MKNILKALAPRSREPFPEMPEFPFDAMARLGEPYLRFRSHGQTHGLSTLRLLVAEGDEKARQALDLLEDHERAKAIWRDQVRIWTERNMERRQ